LTIVSGNILHAVGYASSPAGIFNESAHAAAGSQRRV